MARKPTIREKEYKRYLENKRLIQVVRNLNAIIIELKAEILELKAKRE